MYLVLFYTALATSKMKVKIHLRYIKVNQDKIELKSNSKYTTFWAFVPLVFLSKRFWMHSNSENANNLPSSDSCRILTLGNH